MGRGKSTIENVSEEDILLRRKKSGEMSIYHLTSYRNCNVYACRFLIRLPYPLSVIVRLKRSLPSVDNLDTDERRGKWPP